MRTEGLPLVSPNDTLIKALAVINTGGLEIALIVENNKLLGIMTDGDCRRAILSGAGLDQILRPIMQKNYRSVGPNMRRHDVLDLMRAGSHEQIPVIDPTGELLGLHVIDDLLGASPIPNQAIVLCGGMGTRLRPITEKIPKPMIRVAGRPILERIVFHLVGHGFRRIYLAVHYLGEMIESHFGDGSAFGCEITYLREEQPLGTGGCLGLLDGPVEHPVLVMNGDLVTQFDASMMLERHVNQGNTATVGVHSYNHEIPFGVLDVVDDRVQALREKPSIQQIVNAGIYVLDPGILEWVPKGRASTVPELLGVCLEREKRVGIHFVDEEWMDVGRFEELQRARGIN